MRIVILNGLAMTQRRAAHEYLRQTLDFPAYYGHNLDALADCLGELGPHTHIILTEAEAMRKNLGDYAERLLRVLYEGAQPPYSYHFAVDGE